MVDRTRLEEGPDLAAGLQRTVAVACVLPTPRSAARHIQPKLAVGAVHDPAELEADRVATAVMESIDRSSAATATATTASVAGTNRSRVARSTWTGPTIGPDGGEVDSSIESRIRASTGRPLDGAVRGLMERGFGTDFSGVRVHTNSRVAPQLGATAFTTGTDVHFSPGAYEPSSSAGRHLIAHELTHVVQQGGAVARRRVPRTEHVLVQHDDADCADVRRSTLSGVIQRHASWEHKMLGDVTADDLVVLGAGKDILERQANNQSADVNIMIGGVVRNVTKADVIHVLEQEIARLKLFRDHPPQSASRAAEQQLQQFDLAERTRIATHEAKAEVNKQHGIAILPAARNAKALAMQQQVAAAVNQATADPQWQVRLIGIPHVGGGTTVVSYGELNTLGDFVGNPGQLSLMTATNLHKIVQGIRQESLLKFMRLHDELKGRWAITKFLTQDKLGEGFDDGVGNVGRGDMVGEIRLMKGGKTTVGGDDTTGYTAGLARNACHFAPYSWHAWAKHHADARVLAAQSYAADQQADQFVAQIPLAAANGRAALQVQADTARNQAAELRTKALITNGYADHFLQDSYAAGHLINKDQIMKWYADWLLNTSTAVDYMKDATLKRIALIARNQAGIGVTAAVHDRNTVGVAQPKDIQSVENSGLGYIESFRALGLATPPSVTPSNTNAFKFTYAWQKMTSANPKHWASLTGARAVTMLNAAHALDAGIPTLDQPTCDGLLATMRAEGLADRTKTPITGTLHYKLRSGYVPANRAGIFATPVGDIVAPTAASQGDHDNYEKSASSVTYSAYHEFMNSAVVQAASNILHDHFCKHGLRVTDAVGGQVFKVYGDNAMLAKGSSIGLKHSATTSNMSRDTVFAIIDGGANAPAAHSLDSIRDRFPNRIMWENDPNDIGLDDWHTDPTKLRKFCEDGVFRKANASIKTFGGGVTGGDLAKFVSNYQRQHGAEAF